MSLYRNMHACAILFIGMFILSSNDAYAHSFKVGFIVSSPYSERGVGQDAVNGFMLATAERDSHADQESDGHLGGLDVYLLKLDFSQPNSRQFVRDMIGTENIQFLTGVFSDDVALQVGKQTQGLDINIVRTPKLPSRPPTTMDGELFSKVFAQHYGQTPSEPAYQGYLIARLIDQIVRSIGGDFSDIDIVNKEIERHMAIAK